MGKKVWLGFKFGLLLVGLSLIVVSDLKERERRIRLYPTQAELDSVLPGALLKDRKEKPIPHYPGKVQVEGRSKRAVALLSAELPPEIKGFVDEINILFALDEDGRILKLRVISQRETPYYFRLIRGADFFEKLTGRNYQELREIKAVSGASISSKAILEDLQLSAQQAMREIFQAEVPQARTASLSSIYLTTRIIALILVLLFGLFCRFFQPKRIMRWLGFGLSIGVIGAWLKSPFALPHLFQLLSFRVPFRANPYLVVLGGFVILTTIFSGPLWCRYLCPYAGLQELMSTLGRKYHWTLSSKLVRLARELRWLILFSVVVLYFLFGIRSASELEPFFYLFSGSWSGIGMVLVIFTLLGSFFIPRFWCRFFCPTGACLILLSSHRRFFKSIERETRASGIDTPGSESS